MTMNKYAGDMNNNDLICQKNYSGLNFFEYLYFFSIIDK